MEMVKIALRSHRSVVVAQSHSTLASQGRSTQTARVFIASQVALIQQIVVSQY